jgi:putative transport protein
VNWLAGTLRHYPEVAVFLVIALGALIGKIKLGGVSFGTVTGALFAGLLVGQLNIPVAGSAKAILYLLFLVGNGYSIGPQFFRSLKGEGIRYLALAVFQCVAGLVGAVVMARMLHLDVGMAAGLLSGALTQSPAIGTASETISALPLPQDQRTLLIAHVAIGDALTYLFGTAGTIWFLSLIAPKLLRINLAGEAKKLEDQLHIDHSRSGILSTYTPFALRAYRVRNSTVAGLKVRDFEATYPGRRFYVEQVRRGTAILNAPEETVLAPGDVVALSGRRAIVMEVGGAVGEEVDDKELLDMPGSVQTVTVANPAVIGKPLEELAQWRETRGVYLRRIRRIGQDIPILPGTTLNRGDEVELLGTESALKRFVGMVGIPHPSGAATDLAAVCLAVFAGGLIGVPFVVVHGFRLSLGTAVGALVMGIVLGWLHSVRPSFGRVPEAASSLMISLGLAAFVGMNGMQAGTHFVDAFKAQGVPLLLGGVAVTLFPLICGVFFGRYVLKLNPVLLLGACAGAQTVTAAMAEVQEKSRSRTPVLGYTVPYAIANILLTIWGSVIVTLLSS